MRSVNDVANATGLLRETGRSVKYVHDAVRAFILVAMRQAPSLPWNPHNTDHLANAIVLVRPGKGTRARQYPPGT